MLENVFDRGLDLMERAGLINIFQNLIKSAKFMDIFRGDPEYDSQVCRENQSFMKLLYENIDQDKEPISRETLNELIEMHMVVFLMSLKRFSVTGRRERRLPRITNAISVCSTMAYVHIDQTAGNRSSGK